MPNRGITSPPVGVVDVFVSGKPTEHRLAQHVHDIMATVAAGAPVNQVLLRDGHRAGRVIEFAIGKQSGIGGDAGTDAGTVELQLKAAVEIEPEGTEAGFSAWLHHLRPRSDEAKRRIL